MKKLISRLADVIIVLISVVLLLFNVDRIVWTLEGNKIYTEEKEEKLDGIFRTAEFTEFTEFPIRYGNENLRFCIGKLTNGKRVVVIYTQDSESGLNTNTGIKGMFLRDKKSNEFYKSQIEELGLSHILPEELAEYSFYLNDNPYRISLKNYVLCIIAIMGLLYVIIIKKCFYNRNKKRN